IQRRSRQFGATDLDGDAVVALVSGAVAHGHDYTGAPGGRAPPAGGKCPAGPTVPACILPSSYRRSTPTPRCVRTRVGATGRELSTGPVLAARRHRCHRGGGRRTPALRRGVLRWPAGAEPAGRPPRARRGPRGCRGA